MKQEENKKIFDQLAAHEHRILALEVSFKIKTPQTIKRQNVKNDDYSGPTGGVRYLISGGFFKEKRDLATVRGRLSQEGYHYSRQAVHEALKTLSKASRPLVALKEGRRKTYVERK